LTNKYADENLSKISLPEINDNNIIKNFSNENSYFAILLEEQIPNSIFNLVLKINQEGVLQSEKIYRYRMDSEFVNLYYNGDVDFSSYSGQIELFNPDQIFNLGRQFNDCINDGPCCVINPGGAGLGNSNPGGVSNDPGGFDKDCTSYSTECLPCEGPKCFNTCHDGCDCRPRSRWVIIKDCPDPLHDTTPTNKSSDCCPSGDDTEIPVHPGINPGTVRDEDTGPLDFIHEFQTAANTNSFLDEFLEGNTNLTQANIADAQECGGCNTYPVNETSFAAINGYNQCILNVLINNSDCGGVLEDVMGNSEITLSAADQLNILTSEELSSCGPGTTADVLKVENAIIDYKLGIIQALADVNSLVVFEECLMEIPDWEELAAFIPPVEILNLLEERGGGDWSIQSLFTAPGLTLNVDYFDVTIDQFPSGMNAEQFFNFVQQNFQLFDDGCNSTFNFLEPIDNANWISNNPLGTILSIDIPFDNGSVIVSQYDNSPNSCFCWTFSTIYENSNGLHPVSGNRQFGLTQNPDGTWSFYIRGVDRTTTSTVLNGIEIQSTLGFQGADDLWNCITENIFDYVNDPLNGGLATDTSSESYRPSILQGQDFRKLLLELDISTLLECIHSRG